MKYRIACLGGTFDVPMHQGHKAVLSMAFASAEFVHIGLTTDSLANLKHGKVHQYEERRKQLADYLNSSGFENRYEIVPISDYYGKALLRRDFEAIVVSEETLVRAMEINERRSALGMQKMDILKVETVYGDDNKKLSSTRIRDLNNNK
ncbi:MAG: pantetheine-phosphate adenylyltransferase [Candidatus Aenigmatarchaeota archaeon]